MGFPAEVPPTAVSLLQTQVINIGIGTTGLSDPIDNVTSRLNLIKPACTGVDTYIIPLVNTINAKKQQIVDICALAVVSCGISTLSSAVSTTYGDVVTSVGATYGNLVGLGTTATVGYGVIRKDTLRAYEFPNLENKIYNTDNPVENPDEVDIVVSNAGIGKTTILYQNYSSGTLLGYCFKITGGGGSCTGWASSITTIINEIVSIRNGITSHITAANTTKDVKYGLQLEEWSYQRSIQSQIERANNLNNAVTILQDPLYGGPY
jgi:hypothetical protein